MNKIDSQSVLDHNSETQYNTNIYNKKIGINSNSVINFELNNKEMSHFLIIYLDIFNSNSKK